MDFSRRTFLEVASAATASTLMPAISSAKEHRPPNILLMLGDDHRWDALGCMGNPIINTPNLDRLAGEGVLFKNNFTTTPICGASRASIMTGQYAGTTGIYASEPLSPTQVQQTYWMKLKQAGYRIGFIGKFGVGSTIETMPSEAFDYWKGFPGLGIYFPQGPHGPHLTHIIRDQVNEFLVNTPQDKPFCLSVSFKAPHVQDQAPEQYLPSMDTLSLYRDVNIPPHGRAGSQDIERFPLAIQHSESRHRWGVRFSTPATYEASIKGYYRLISGIDAAIASIRETLNKRGLADNTIILYSADHGIFNGEHGLAGKWYPHEESIRTPLIIFDPRLPVNIRGQHREALTLNIDLHSTVLEMAGIPPQASTQGQSLVSLLSEDRRDFRSIFFIEHHMTYGGWIPSSEAIRTKRWKYIHYTDYASPYEELYDLENDPYEVNNLIAHPHYVRQQSVLREYRLRWRDSFRTRSTHWTPPISERDIEVDRVM